MLSPALLSPWSIAPRLPIVACLMGSSSLFLDYRLASTIRTTLTTRMNLAQSRFCGSSPQKRQALVRSLSALFFTLAGARSVGCTAFGEIYAV